MKLLTEGEVLESIRLEGNGESDARFKLDTKEYFVGVENGLACSQHDNAINIEMEER